MTRFVSTGLLVMTISLWPSATAQGADLQAGTQAAFDRYVRLTEARMSRELRGDSPFLWVDRLPARQRAEADSRLRAGEIVVSSLDTRDGAKDIDIPDGLRHHWIGTVFLSDVSLAQTVAFMQRYDRYQDAYAPNVRRSRLIARNGDRFNVYLQLFMKKVVSVVLNTEYDVRYMSVGTSRMHVRSYATRIAEVEDAGTPTEREQPVGHDSGYLWRFNNYCGLESRNEGTYVQCETVSLSRDVPFGLGWFIRPFVTSVPRESLEFTLQAMRKALTRRA